MIATNSTTFGNHEGHEHFVNPITHHFLEGLIVVLFVFACVVAIRGWRRHSTELLDR